jgi:hypothetical protein
MNRETKRRLRSTIEEFALRTGKSVEDGINEIAMSAGRRLAHTVQPYGITATSGAKFVKSIGNQVDQVWFGVNLGAYPPTGDIRAAHYEQRFSGSGRKGSVKFRQFRKERGQKWLDLITVGQKEDYKRKQQAKAGRAKGAWVAATNDLGGKKLSGVAAWIARHDKSSMGTAKKTGAGLKYKAELENKTPYLTSIQPDRAVAAAVTFGLKNGMKRIQKVIDGEIRKANKKLSA